MDIRKFGKIFKQINKVPIDYEDDADIKLRGERNYHKKSLDGGYSYTPKLVPIFSWNLSDDVRLTAIKNIDILRKRRPYIFLTTFTSDSVPKYPIVICDKPIDNEELFSIRNKIGAERFVEKFNKTLLHYFKIKIKNAQENNIGNYDVKTFNNNIMKLKGWFWGNDIDRDKTESFIDEKKLSFKKNGKNDILHKNESKDSTQKELDETKNILRVTTNKLIKERKKTKFKLAHHSNEEIEDSANECRFKTGRLNLTKLGNIYGVDPDTVKNEIKRRDLTYILNS